MKQEEAERVMNIIKELTPMKKKLLCSIVVFAAEQRISIADGILTKVEKARTKSGYISKNKIKDIRREYDV